ncbi:MAG: hypothetical protein VX970_06575 [Planctomycetota bacterium]|nr:hypothetical protein [Planctomycetota bacterium]
MPDRSDIEKILGFTGASVSSLTNVLKQLACRTIPPLIGGSGVFSWS